MATTDWLHEDEVNRIPMQALSLLDDMIRENRPIVFRNSEGNGSGALFIIRIGNVPISMAGNEAELYTNDFEANFMVVKDQIIRYVRWLKTEIYPRYHVG